MGDLVTGSSGAIAPKKEHVASYVHDAAELECAIFTLDRSIRACEESIKGVVSNVERKVNDAHRSVLTNAAKCEESRERLDYYNSLKPRGGNFRRIMLIGLSISFVALFIHLGIIICDDIDVFKSLINAQSPSTILPSLVYIILVTITPLFYATVGIIVTLIIAFKKGKTQIGGK